MAVGASRDAQQDPFGAGFRVVGAIAAIAGVTWVFSQWVPVNPTTAGFLFLITILLIAATWGLVESLAASLVGTLCFNYFFFPPVRTFSIADPHNWVSLAAFLATSLIASHLSQRAKRKAREAAERRLEMQRLYDLSRAILLTSPEEPIGKQMAREIARIYDLAAVAILDQREGKVHASGSEDLLDLVEGSAEAGPPGNVFRDPQAGSVVAEIRLAGRSIGSLALKGAIPSASGIQALSNLIAIGLERVRAEQAARQAEAARQTEEFKSTLLDALAHEFKTPLTSIRAAASGLLSAGTATAEHRGELLTVIDEEARRLAALVTEATHLSRIEAGQLQLHRQPQGVRALVEMSLGQMASTLEGRRVEVRAGADLPDLHVDSELARLVLCHLLDNAVKYSPPGSPIVMAAEPLGSTVVICVQNQGGGISEAEQSRIFERFYRGRGNRREVDGTGMGLAIAQEIVRAHGGDLRVESNPGQGCAFFASFPIVKKGVRV